MPIFDSLLGLKALLPLAAINYRKVLATLECKEGLTDKGSWIHSKQEPLII